MQHPLLAETNYQPLDKKQLSKRILAAFALVVVAGTALVYNSCDNPYDSLLSTQTSEDLALYDKFLTQQTEDALVFSTVYAPNEPFAS
jgi:hypothetical protein